LLHRKRSSTIVREIGMERGLSGRRALVTGASRGIGLAIARRLAAAGARVAMNAAHARDRLDEAVAEVPGAVPFFADVGDPVAVEAMLEAARRELGAHPQRGPVRCLQRHRRQPGRVFPAARSR